MKKKVVHKIPKFKNYEEEVNFWDTHSFADYWDELKDVDLVVELTKPREETLILRVQKNLKRKLAIIAKKRGINVSSLARIWLMEKLRQAG